jgi:hypothetical protein
MKIGIYQVAYNDEGLKAIDPEFIRYFNENKDQFFENHVILELYKSQRYRMFDYFGVLSWRFFQKTGITGKKVMKLIYENPYCDAFTFMPPGYKQHQHPYNRKKFPPSTILAQMIDDRNILPFKLYHYDTMGLIVWCNYWVIKSKKFPLYIENYLLPLVRYLQNPDEEVRKFISIKHHHRPDGIDYTVIPFFLEGLFSVFCRREKLIIKSI